MSIGLCICTILSCRLEKAVRKGGFLCYIRKQLPGRKLFYTFLCRAKAQADFFSGCSVPAATALV